MKGKTNAIGPVNDNIVQCINGDFFKLDGTSVYTGSRQQLISYVGSGRAGQSYPCSVTFDFAPDMVRMVGFTNKATSSAASTYHSILAITLHQASKNKTFVAQDNIICSLLTTSWRSGLGMNYGFEYSSSDTPWTDDDLAGNTAAKKSEDGKTISWYFSYGYAEPPLQQFNKSGYTYYVLGIKF